jgi:hypothetical protein
MKEFSTLELNIKDELLSILMIQSLPGHERVDCDRIERLFQSISEKSDSYFSFSEFDIVKIIQYSDSFHELLNNNQILDNQQIICYQWDLEPKIIRKPRFSFYHWKLNPIEYFQQIRLKKSPFKSNAITISLIKLTDLISHDNGVNDEIKIIKKIQKLLLQLNVKFLLLGSMGLPEIVLILGGENLEKLLQILQELLINSEQNKLGLTYIHTFPCINSNIALKYFDANYQENITESLGDIFWKISITCHPNDLVQQTNKLIEKGNDWSFDVFSTFGKRDIEIIPKENEKTSIGHLLKIIGYIRSTNTSNWIVSTQTQFSVAKFRNERGATVNVNDINANIQRERDSQALEKVNGKLQFYVENLEKLTKIEKVINNPSVGFSENMKKMLFRTKSLLLDPALMGQGLDVLEYALWAGDEVSKFIGDLEEKFDNKTITIQKRRQFQHFDEMIRAYIYGINQRLLGVHFSDNDPAQAFSGIYGFGIQRYINAVNAIPRALLRSFSSFEGKDWHGFTVFDYYPTTLILASRVINLPFSYLNDPSLWWSLGHESGHAFYKFTNLGERPIILNTISKLENSKSFISLGIRADTFIEELFATVFEYQLCYRKNFELHQENIWEFFNYFLPGRIDVEKCINEYFFRTLFTFFYHVEQKGGIIPGLSIFDLFPITNEKDLQSNYRNLKYFLLSRPWHEYGSFKNVVQFELLEKTAERAPNILFELRLLDFQILEDIYKISEELRGEFSRVFTEYECPNLEENIFPAKILKIYEQLLLGNILVLDNPLDVFLITIAQKEINNGYKRNEITKNQKERARIAALLSLWHWDRIETQKYRETTYFNN